MHLEFPTLEEIASWLKSFCVHSSFPLLTEISFLRGALGADSSCGSPGEGTCMIRWWVNQRCTATIRSHQIPESTKQTAERADKRGRTAFDPLIWRWLFFFGDSQLILIRLPACVTCCWDKGRLWKTPESSFGLHKSMNVKCNHFYSFLFGASGSVWDALHGHDFRYCVKRRLVRPLLVRTVSRRRADWLGQMWNIIFISDFTSSPLWWIRLKLSACVGEFRCETLFCITVVPQWHSGCILKNK